MGGGELKGAIHIYTTRISYLRQIYYVCESMQSVYHQRRWGDGGVQPRVNV